VGGLHGKEIAESGRPRRGPLPEGTFSRSIVPPATHTLSGGDNPVSPKVADGDRKRIRERFDRLETLADGAMPPLKASPAEKDALSDFLVSTQRGGAQ
jgi:hypothetical protein